MSAKIFVLREGVKRRYEKEGRLFRNPLYASITLVETNFNVLVDTGGRGDEELLVEKLREHNLSPDDIDYVINTHTHPDHNFNNFLFKKAFIIEGNSTWPPKEGINWSPYTQEADKLKDVQIITTPGHTPSHISVLVECDGIKYVIAGDVFNEDDLLNKTIPAEDKSNASFLSSERTILQLADIIILGHGRTIKLDSKQKERYLKLLEKSNVSALK